MPLAVVTSAHDFRRACQEARVDGELALVPTMGYLHAGHQSLIKNAAQRAPAVAVTIFVNPSQFAPGEDLARYPRDLPGDLHKCDLAGATFVFAPTNDAELYPPGFQTYVEPGPLAQPMEGEKRPGHFRGVCTVVAKLFNLLSPTAAVFGEKDFQQLAVIRRMVRDLNFPIEIIGVPTVREADGLACSSRNQYLNSEERAQVPALQRALQEAQRLFAGGERSAEAIQSAARNIIATVPLARIDYLEVVNADTLQSVITADAKSLILVAAFFGQTRLIDNLRLS